MPWFRARRLAAHVVTCLLPTVLPSGAFCQTEPDGAPQAVIWEGAPLEWIERGEIVLYEAEGFALHMPPEFYGDAPVGTYPGETTSVTFPTGIGIELRAERTSFDAKGRPESPPRTVSYGGIWVATPLARDAAMPRILEVVESLATMPLSSFDTRAPRVSWDPTAFFATSDSPFLTQEPSWICYEFPDSTIATETLSRVGEGQSFRWGNVHRHPSRFAPVCRSLMERVREAGSKTSIPARLAYERRPRRRLLFALFRSPDTPSEVTVSRSYLEIGKNSGYMMGYLARDLELELWLARSAPVVLRFRLEEEGGEKPLRWTQIAEWIVAVHPSKVSRPEGGIEEDLRSFTEELVKAARTYFPETLARTLRGASFLDVPDFQREHLTGRGEFRRGILVEEVARFLKWRPLLAVVCRDGTAVYSQFPSPLDWNQARNGGEFCDEMKRALSTLEQVPVE